MTPELVPRVLDGLLAGEVPRTHLVGRFDAPAPTWGSTAAWR